MVISQMTTNMVSFQAAIRPKMQAEFVNWQGKFSTAISGAPGFVSLEFLCSSPKEQRWEIIQRFSDASKVAQWRESTDCMELEKLLQGLSSPEGVKEKGESETNLKNGVTEVIITHVPLEKESEFREWNAKIHQIEAQFKGFRSIYIQSPIQTGSRNWITLLQFDSPQDLDFWLKSSQRQEILREGASIMTSFESHRVASPYAGWFSSIARTEGMPSAWKQTLLVILVLFPIVMLQMKYLSPWTRQLDISLGTFLACTMSVTLISFPMMPLTVKLLGWWLKPSLTTYKTIYGVILISFLYLIEVLIFWSFIGKI